MSHRYAEQNPNGPMFRNTEGRPWVKDSVNCRFHQLQKKVGRKVALVDFRHGYCDRLLKAGVDAVVVASLMGHVNVGMVANVYTPYHRMATT